VLSAFGMLLLLLLLLLLQGTCRSDVNDGIISRPRLLARDPTLFSLLQYIYTPSVVRMRYRAICPACSSKWTPEAAVPLLEPAPAVSGGNSDGHCSSTGRLLGCGVLCCHLVPGCLVDSANLIELLCSMAEQLHCFLRSAIPAVDLQVPLIKLPLEQCIGSASNWRPVPYSAPDCADLDPDCRARAISGQCDTQPDMLTRCQLSCGLCRQVSSSPGCYDWHTSCLVAASVQGRCQNDSAAMGPQGLGCMLSCGGCTAAREMAGRRSLVT
jgi:hypothetical protein